MKTAITSKPVSQISPKAICGCIPSKGNEWNFVWFNLSQAFEEGTMHRLSITALVGILTLTIAGCGSGGQENNATATTTVTGQPAPKPLVKPTQPFVKPTQLAQNPQKKSQNTKSPSSAGLIQPTNVNQRTQQVQKGRSDPFAGLFVVPKVSVAAKPQTVPPLAKVPIAVPPKPIVKPTPLPPPVAYVPPQPDLAKGVTVLGIVQIGSEYQAIVQVPDEATSRYVSEGQRLSNGQVLVKRIEMNPSSEPLVILEENGIEVTRTVGEETVKPEEASPGRPNRPGRSASAIPLPPPSLGSSPRSVAELKTLLPAQPLTDFPLPPPPPSGSMSVESLKSKLKQR